MPEFYTNFFIAGCVPAMTQTIVAQAQRKIQVIHEFIHERKGEGTGGERQKGRKDVIAMSARISKKEKHDLYLKSTVLIKTTVPI